MRHASRIAPHPDKPGVHVCSCGVEFPSRMRHSRKSCGCLARELGVVSAAILVRGETLSLGQLRAKYKIGKRWVQARRREGKLTPARVELQIEWLESYRARRRELARARANGVPANLLRKRQVEHGWSAEKAATQPVAKRTRRAV